MAFFPKLRWLVVASTVVVAVTSGIPAPAAVAGDSGWRIIELESLNSPLSINDRGDIAGQLSISALGRTHAALWRGGVVTDLGAFNGGNSVAVDINNRGEVVGFNMVDDAQGNTTIRGFIWRDGVMTDLGTLGGDQTSVAAINDRGEVVGSSRLANGSSHAFVWRDGVMSDLDTSSGGYSTAYDINDRGQVVGASTLGVEVGTPVPVVWDRSGVHPLEGVDGTGKVINDRGDIAGTTLYSMQAFFWRHGRVTTIDPAPETAIHQVNGINNRGAVVGATSFHPYVWRDGRFTRLPDYGGGNAQDINESGTVVGMVQTGGMAPVFTAVMWVR